MTLKGLQAELESLKREHSLAGLKCGTEVEAMNFEEIEFMRSLSRGIAPLTAKIGGPEARADIDNMLEIGVDNILAPMIESPYGLSNFIKAACSLKGEKEIKLSINLETVTGYEQLHKIAEHPAFKEIYQVTVGRSDLAASMEKDVDDEEVLKVSSEIVTLSRLKGKKSSVGGRINRLNAGLLKRYVASDYINTRHVVIYRGAQQIELAVERGLRWEHSFYRLLKKEFPRRAPFYEERMDSIEKRLEPGICITGKDRKECL